VTSQRAAKSRLLDLFSGAGGAAMGYHRSGFDVVGVDIHPQPRYPFDFEEGDAIVWLEDWLSVQAEIGFDAIHASPPCQNYSRMHGSTGPDLIGPTRELLEATGLPYVIENVEGAPLHEPRLLCGSMFDLDVERHRLFETNWPLPDHDWPCRHGIWAPRFDVQDHGKRYKSRVVPVYGSGGGKAAEHWPAAMGIDWMTRSELAEAIPPAYTEHIGRFLLEHLEAVAA
jgi:DNA (cytosine-5)-methyltransferase 1